MIPNQCHNDFTLMKKLFFLITFIAQCGVSNAQKKSVFSPAKVWFDNKGLPINAHGGGVIFHEGMYYWYGEHKLEGKSEAKFADGGIHCYASKDLLNWKDKGVVLGVDFKDTTTDLTYGCILERPKVVYNQKNREFVAFFQALPQRGWL